MNPDDLDRIDQTVDATTDEHVEAQLHRVLDAAGYDSEPRTPSLLDHAQHILTGIWTELLGGEQINANDTFFGLGGDSLTAIELISRARQSGLDLDLADLFEQPTLAALAAKAAAGPSAQPSAARTPVVAPVRQPSPSRSPGPTPERVTDPDRITVDVERLRPLADRYRRLHRRLVAVADDLHKQAGEVRHAWGGPAAETFLNSQHDMEEALRQAAQFLDNSATGLRSACEVFSTGDQHEPAVDAPHLPVPPLTSATDPQTVVKTLHQLRARIRTTLPVAGGSNPARLVLVLDHALAVLSTRSESGTLILAEFLRASPEGVAPYAALWVHTATSTRHRAAASRILQETLGTLADGGTGGAGVARALGEAISTRMRPEDRELLVRELRGGSTAKSLPNVDAVLAQIGGHMRAS